MGKGDVNFYSILILLLILYFVLPAVGNYLWKKKYPGKGGYLIWFSICYFLLSSLSYSLRDVSSEYIPFTFVLLIPPILLSYPMGLLVFYSARMFEGFNPPMYLFILAGTVQWLLIAFIYRKWKIRKANIRR